MELIFIYGPPAVGKLSVAKELTKQTRYKNFHNHKAYDLVSSVIDEKNANFSGFVKTIMLKGIEMSLENKKGGIIFTFCYEKGKDDEFVKKVIKKVKRKNGKVYFVQLFCEEKELFKRVKEQSRKKFGKIRTKKTLKEVLKRWKLKQNIPFVNNLTINNTKIKPNNVAKMIIKQYKITPAPAPQAYNQN